MVTFMGMMRPSWILVLGVGSRDWEGGVGRFGADNRCVPGLS